MTSKDTAAATTTAELIKHTAEITASTLIKFTADNAVLTANIEFIKKDLAELKADFKDSKLRYIDVNQHEELCKSNADQETRIRLLETQAVQTRTWGVALIIAIGIIEFFISKFL